MLRARSVPQQTGLEQTWLRTAKVEGWKGGEDGEVGVGVGGTEVAQPLEGPLSVGRLVRLQCVQE